MTKERWKMGQILEVFSEYLNLNKQPIVFPHIVSAELFFFEFNLMYYDL